MFRQRSNTHQFHLSSHQIPQIWQLIYPPPTQPSPHSCYTKIICYLSCPIKIILLIHPLLQILRIRIHRAQLINIKSSTISTHTPQSHNPSIPSLRALFNRNISHLHHTHRLITHLHNLKPTIHQSPHQLHPIHLGILLPPKRVPLTHYQTPIYIT